MNISITIAQLLQGIGAISVVACLVLFIRFIRWVYRRINTLQVFIERNEEQIDAIREKVGYDGYKGTNMMVGEPSTGLVGDVEKLQEDMLKVVKSLGTDIMK